MIKIVHGAKTMMVSKGAYKAIYEPSGWSLANGASEQTAPAEVQKPDPTPEQLAAERKAELIKIPVGNMSKDELKEAAELLGVSITKEDGGNKTKEEVKREVAGAIATEV